MRGKLLLLFMVMMAFSLPTFAQKAGGKHCEGSRKELMEIKLDFLAKEIDLKEDQKALFNQTYTQMENERWEIYKKIKAAKKSVKGKEASEAEYEKANAEIEAAKAEMGKVEKKYDEKFSSFLTKKQMYRLKEAEMKYMQKAQECRDKKKDGKKKK